ncbi:NADH:flavorubredoxin reductase NorW [Parasalinivibrio latis]|uniref:NADH:flavorubredoxin reductase NorW n=1 Tax=Parasalinivibrio latis TaxID=2952610 RepID=UPI0030E25EC6
MNAPIVIIGSGFAAYQLVKSLRKQAPDAPITVITAGNGDSYNKPDISHVFTKSQNAADLVKQTGAAFAEENQVTLIPQTPVDGINPVEKTVTFGKSILPFSKLVIAKGASAFVPPMEGDATQSVLTLNSIEEYEAAQDRLSDAKRVLVMGGGLIGTEIAMDLASSGRSVTLADPADSLLSNLLPDVISASLYKTMAKQNIHLTLNDCAVTMNRMPEGIEVTLKSGMTLVVDEVISAVGLRPRTQLAKDAGLAVNRGIIVDRQMQTSAPDVYALGDCAEIEGKVLSYLQPILLSANALAKTLAGQPTKVSFPPMLVRVKTPLLPIQLSGNTTGDSLRWEIHADRDGLIAKAYNVLNKMVGFVVTQNHMKDAFPLLRELPPVL